jgi:carotenoid cleavage dioxygenase
LTLETKGEFHFNGSLNDISPFSAHPKIDRHNGEMYNFGIAYSASDPSLNLYRFDKKARLRYRRRLPLNYACSIHDFGLSSNYVVFYLSPYILNMRVLAQQGGTLMDSLQWEPDKTSRLLIASRETGEQVATLELESQYCLHFINCFERDDSLFVDVLELERPIYDQYQVLPAIFTDVCEGSPVRFEVDVRSGTVLNKRTVNYRLAPDFPSIDPLKQTVSYDDFWMLGISATGRRGRKFFDQLVHVNWTKTDPCDIYQAPLLHYLCGEPIFIADPLNRGTGVVMCQIFDAKSHRFSFAFLNGRDVASGPVASIHMKEPIHLGFHASFISL